MLWAQLLAVLGPTGRLVIFSYSPSIKTVGVVFPQEVKSYL